MKKRCRIKQIRLTRRARLRLAELTLNLPPRNERVRMAQARYQAMKRSVALEHVTPVGVMYFSTLDSRLRRRRNSRQRQMQLSGTRLLARLNFKLTNDTPVLISVTGQTPAGDKVYLPAIVHRPVAYPMPPGCVGNYSK